MSVMMDAAMNTHLNPAISAEMRQATAGFDLYHRPQEKKPGPGVSYVNTAVAYVANLTLIHEASLGQEAYDGMSRYTLTKDSEILLAQRGHGDGNSYGLWGGVSGYIDTMYDPRIDRTDSQALKANEAIFDPIAYTARTELQEECGMDVASIQRVRLYLGERFSTQMGSNGRLHVMPLSGVYTGAERPAITVDGHELLDAQWVPLGQVAEWNDIKPSYLHTTLPRALGGLGVDVAQVRDLL